jgi:hypothetical protein
MRTTLVILAMAAALASCDMGVTYGRCLSSHTEYGTQYIYGADGQLAGFMPTSSTVCDQREFPEGRSIK